MVDQFGLKSERWEDRNVLVLSKRHPSRNGTEITSKNSMNVLGVHFDAKLNWQTHVQTAITKSQKALQAIKLIKKHFTKKRIVITGYIKLLFNLIL